MKARSLGLAIGLSTFAMSLSSTSGAIISTSGDGLQIAPPLSCAVGALPGPQTAHCWDELQGIAITGLNVDMVNNPGSSGAPVAGTISGVVDSHFIHVEDFSGLPPAVGTVTFNNPIIGVAIFNTTLDNTDIYGAAGTTYPTFFPNRDLTFNGSFFSINSNVLTFNLTNISPVLGVMQLRVFTRVPTPGVVSVAGLAGIAALRRSRREN